MQLSETKGHIYIIRNRINGKGYVGQTVSSLKERLWKHQVSSRYDNNSALHGAIRKYGIGSFSIVEVVSCDRLLLNDLETHYIRFYGTYAPTGHGYNLTEGGDSVHFTDETKAKMRTARLGKCMSLETKAKISSSRKGQHHSSETLAKMSAWQRGSCSEEKKAKISKSLKGRKPSKETRVKMSAARKRIKGGI
jgi:group I intron endonuclease